MGTWNRLDKLQQAIEATRKSVYPYDYEIIVVDGGSTDGTIEWLRQQPGVIVVEQGRLLGATRAYNPGFRLSRAPFVVEINDDDLPISDCISYSVLYMIDHPDVGQAAYMFDCWKEDRYQFDTVWGKVYVNKGITRRELGDRAGWWDEKFHTYAADTELSCRIREMGYKVVALRECKVKDLKTRDALREANNPEGVPNPDSKLFYEQRDRIAPPLPTDRRILHVALNVPGDNQPALERALRSLGEYRQVDWRKSTDLERELAQVVEEFEPNLMFMQIQTPGIISAEFLENLPIFRIVNWSGDVRNEIGDWYFDIGKVPGVITCVTNVDWAEEMRRNGLDARYLQIGFNQEIYHPWGPAEETGDIVFLGNYYGKNHFPLSKLRLDMVKGLREKYGDCFRCYGAGWPFSTKRTNHQREVQVYRGCKIAVGISEFDLQRYTSDRLFRAMGSGAFYLARYYPGCEEDFLPEYHLDYWHTLDELYEKVDYYLERPVIREVIAKRGCEHVHANHTWLDRAQQLEEMIGWHKWM
jgi:glycosyltransferase involved in cell wall biosynthesis